MKRLFIALFFLSIWTLPCLAQEQENNSSPVRHPLKISPGYTKVGSRSLFALDSLIPFTLDEESLFFLNHKVVLEDDSIADEQNAGLGFRQLLSNGELLLGANLYYDSKQTDNNVRHEQVGFGLEAFWKEWVDLRGNFYYPVSQKQLLRESTTFAFGRRALVARRQSVYEEPLMGFDTECGVLVPYLSNIIESRVYFGGYHYFPELSDDVHGIMARFEARPVPALAIDVQMKKDDTFGQDIYVGAYVSLPFNLGNLAQKKNPFEGWKEAFAFGQGPRKPAQRMTDMVVRDIDVATSANGSVVTESTAANMIYVDNSNDNDVAEDGTLEHPYNTLAEAFADARYGQNIWIYLDQGDSTATGYTGNYNLQNGVVLWGSGYQYLGLGGSGYPVLQGTGGIGNIITLANNNTVMGLQLQNGDIGISGQNVSGVTINNNYITNTNTDAINIQSNGTGNAQAGIFNNSIVNNLGWGIRSQSNDNSHLSMIITNNSVVASTLHNLDVRADDNSTSSLIVTGNTLAGSAFFDGARLYAEANAAVNAMFSDNVITGNLFDGMQVGDPPLFLGACTVDLGGGAFNSPGNNSIYFNYDFEIENILVTQLTAQNNWWGQAPPLAGNFNGNINLNNYLSSDPNQ